MSQQSDKADAVYDRLAESDVSAAELVQELRARWGPDHKAPEVHGFVEEVAACILHHEDVQIGEVHDQRFSAWPLERWEVHDKFARELLALDAFLEDAKKYVFHRRKT
jgi:hypothetical protein